jgi:hypothetical protein
MAVQQKLSIFRSMTRDKIPGSNRVGGIVHVRQHCASIPPYGLTGALHPEHRFGSQVSITDMLTRLRPVVGVVHLSGDHFG